MDERTKRLKPRIKSVLNRWHELQERPYFPAPGRMDGMPTQRGGESRPVEKAVLRGADTDDQRVIDAINEAIRIGGYMGDKTVCRIGRFLCQNGIRPAREIAESLYCSQNVLDRRIADFYAITAALIDK